MVTYLIKSTLCLVLFLAFYHLVLEREKMHSFNRYYLLSSVLISFLAPLYTIYIKVIQEPIEFITQISDYTIFTEEITPISEPINYWSYVLYFSAGISVILLLRFFKNLYSIYRKVSISDTFKHKSATIVLVEDNILPHTFWNYIFINKKAYETKELEQELFTHELTHVAQKHTLDVLLIELLKVVFWFNPVFYVLKKAVQLNHEFLADTNVVSQHKNVSKYQHLLINTSAWSNEYALASNLHYLVTKKRIVMMTKQTSKAVIRLKKLAVLPLLIGAIFLFAERVEAQEEIIEVVEDQQNLQEIELLREFSFRNIVTKISKDKNGDAYYRDYYSFSEEEKSKQIPGKLNSKQLKEFELFKKNKRENKLPKLKRLDIIESYKIFSKKIKKDRKFRDGDYISLTNIYKELSVRQKKLVESPKVVFGKMAPKKEYIDAPIKRKSSKQSISSNQVLEDDNKLQNLNTYIQKTEEFVKKEKHSDKEFKEIEKLYNALSKSQKNKVLSPSMVLKTMKTLKEKLNIKEKIENSRKNVRYKLVENDTVKDNISASKAEMAEYNSILNRIKKKLRFIKVKDVTKLESLYNSMSENQKNSVEDYKKVIPPPPPPMDIIYTYQRLAKRVQATSKNRKANMIYLKELYSKMNALQKKQVTHPSRVLPPPPPRKMASNTQEYKILMNKKGGLFFNGKETSINNLENTLNRVISNKKNAHIFVISDVNTKKDDINKVKNILRENNIYKISINDNLLPPPPPMLKKGEKSNIPPPPPPNKKSGKVSSNDSKEKGWFQTDKETLYYVKENGETKYYNRWGNEVDKEGKKKSKWKVDNKVNVIDIKDVKDGKAIKKELQNYYLLTRFRGNSILKQKIILLMNQKYLKKN